MGKKWQPVLTENCERTGLSAAEDAGRLCFGSPVTCSSSSDIFSFCEDANCCPDLPPLPNGAAEWLLWEVFSGLDAAFFAVTA